MSYTDIDFNDYIRLSNPDDFSWHIIKTIGDKEEFWLKKGKFHRTDGPAYIGSVESGWYVDNITYMSNKSYQMAAKLSDEDMLALVIKYGNVT